MCSGQLCVHTLFQSTLPCAIHCMYCAQQVSKNPEDQKVTFGCHTAIYGSINTDQ